MASLTNTKHSSQPEVYAALRHVPDGVLRNERVRGGKQGNTDATVSAKHLSIRLRRINSTIKDPRNKFPDKANSRSRVRFRRHSRFRYPRPPNSTARHRWENHRRASCG